MGPARKCCCMARATSPVSPTQRFPEGPAAEQLDEWVRPVEMTLGAATEQRRNDRQPPEGVADERSCLEPFPIRLYDHLSLSISPAHDGAGAADRRLQSARSPDAG